MKSALFARTDNDRVDIDPGAGIFAMIAAVRVALTPSRCPIELEKRDFFLPSDAIGDSKMHTHSDIVSTHAIHARVRRNIANSFHRQHRDHSRRVRHVPFDAQAVRHNGDGYWQCPRLPERSALSGILPNWPATMSRP
ncbi:MAG: hypothetical protein K2X57_20620, partial [Xanthobacteraceae bacterium]|nr:hypothetical protein [Xanthobacteraceae bacterium]